MKILSEPKPKISLFKKRIKKVREKFNELRDRFSKPEIKEIRRNIYNIKKKSFHIKNKRDWKKSFWIRIESYKIEKFHDYDGIECKGIRDVGNLFDLPIDEDYHKSIRTNSAFNSNYIECESKKTQR